jgi:nicotinate phosphoribosyltransferase
MMQDVKLTKEEQKYLFENTKTTQDYLVNFLSKFQFKPSQLKIEKISENPGISIRLTGPVEEASLWEMPLMYTISELYFRKLYGRQFNLIVEKAKEDLKKAVTDLKVQYRQAYQKTWHTTQFTFSEFGTRRRLCKSFQDFAIKYLLDQIPKCLVGTSNIELAKKHGIKPVGTMAYEYIEFYQAFHHLLDSQKMAISDWILFYRGWLGIALTDTLGSNQWDRDFDRQLMIDYTGQRHDSADPVVWADRRLAAYKREKVDPMEKTLLFSDNLTFEKAFNLSCKYQDKVGAVTHGIGTFITNRIPSVPGHKALNQVVKIVWANGRPVAKTSDDPIKGQCEDEDYYKYVCHCTK